MLSHAVAVVYWINHSPWPNNKNKNTGSPQFKSIHLMTVRSYHGVEKSDLWPHT